MQHWNFHLMIYKKKKKKIR